MGIQLKKIFLENKKKKTGIIVEARSDSTRLPGKHFLKILNKPVLEHLIKRLKKIKNADKIIVATALILLVMDGTIRHYEVIAAIIILTREILISGLREFLAKGKIKLPVSNLSKLKTVLQMVSIALLLSGDTGNKIINFQDYNAQTIGIILLWLSAFLTLFTGYDYMRKGIDHAMSEDNKD